MDAGVAVLPYEGVQAWGLATGTATVIVLAAFDAAIAALLNFQGGLAAGDVVIAAVLLQRPFR